MAQEGVPLAVIQRQLGHANLGGHIDLSARDRQLRDHPHGPLATGAGDPRHSRPAHDALARSRAGGPELTGPPSARSREVGVATEILVTMAEQVSDDQAAPPDYAVSRARRYILLLAVFIWAMRVKP